jgi:hypothetical protein
MNEEDVVRRQKLESIKAFCIRFNNEFLIPNFLSRDGSIKWLPEEVIVTGGIMHNIFHNSLQKVNDIDVFLLAGRKIISPSADHFEKLGLFEMVTASTIPERPDHVIFSGVMIDRYTNFNLLLGDIRLRVNIIATKFSSRRELLDSFDMVHTRMAFSGKEDSSYSVNIFGQITNTNNLKTLILEHRDCELVYSDLIYHCIENKLIMKNPKIKGDIQKYRLDKILDQGWKLA